MAKHKATEVVKDDQGDTTRVSGDLESQVDSNHEFGEDLYE